jgi:transposase
MSGRKLTVDWKHTAEELYAHYNNTPNTQIARRFQALTLLRRGRTRKETAEIVGVSIRTVQKWLTWYRTGGLDELTRRTRGGNRIPVRPLLTPNQQAQLLQHAATQGFRTLREAAAWCRETLGVELSERQMQRLFHRLGFGARYRVRWQCVRTLRYRRSGKKGVWRGVDGAGGARGAAGGVCGRVAGGVDWSGASALDGAWGQVVSAGGAFVCVAVLAGSC